MPNDSYCVSVVLDGEFGSRISARLQAGPVWIVKTPTNLAATKEMWTLRPKQQHLEGVTVFDVKENSVPEDVFIGILDTVDLHHGIYSADPPYTTIQVIGCLLNERIETTLGQLGFNDFFPMDSGFRGTRPLPQIDESISAS
jgi:hypothetical protein